MKELLKRWAELEPERCSIGGLNGNIWLCFGIGIRDMLIENHYGLALIQYAVQQAIEARGWDWHLMSIVPHAHAARITKGKISNQYRLADSQEDSPAHALLSAYIQALEATL